MWRTAFIPGGDPEGNPIISVLAKQTWTLEPGRLTLSEEQEELVESDQLDDPANMQYGEVLAETDYLVWKPTTDVVVLGRAWSPRGKQAWHLDCEVRVGPYHKVVRVFGNRRVIARPLRGYALSDPEPFESIPLGYRYAYGGVACDRDGTVLPYFPNPIGRGFAIKGGFEDESNLSVPNLEDPHTPLTSDTLVLDRFEAWEHAPRPASLGWTRRTFYPRYTYAGVLPEYLEAARKNALEMARKDPRCADMPIPVMDYRVYQGASEGLWSKKLAGNEPFTLTYLDPDTPRFEAALPGKVPVLTLDLGAGPRELEPNLHTVVIDMDRKRVLLVWRGSLRYGGLEELATLTRIEAAAA